MKQSISMLVLALVLAIGSARAEATMPQNVSDLVDASYSYNGLAISQIFQRVGACGIAALLTAYNAQPKGLGLVVSYIGSSDQGEEISVTIRIQGLLSDTIIPVAPRVLVPRCR